MYRKHFGLERRIFRGNAAGPDVFVGPQVAGIVSGVKKALLGTDAVVSVTGPVGSGKSTAVAHALSSIGGKNAIVHVGRFPLQRGELLDLLFDHMRIQNRPPRSNQKLVLFRQLLFNLAQNNSRMFILVEDAPFVGPQLLAELEVITAADTGPSDGANVILMGDEHLKGLLKEDSLARLRQRIRLRRNLEPLSAQELGGYLRHSFRQAGGDFDKIFAEDGVEFLHELSGGIVRVANNLVESSLEAAAETGAQTVELKLVGRIADEEFGLTGKFTTPPQIASKKPDPKHTDDATAELVALSLPGSDTGINATVPDPEPAAADPDPTTADPAPVRADDDIPELIQDTEPALSILPEIPADDAIPELIQDTLPDLETLSPELARQAEALQELDDPVVEEAPAAVAKPAIPTLSDPAPAVSKPDVPSPTAAERETTPADPAPAPEPLPVPEPPAIPELTLEDEPVETTAEADAVAEEDKPDWDRDPTLAELRPDLEALERAMAVAHGLDPEAGEQEQDEEPQPAPEESKENGLEGVPEITLDESINRKVDAAELERRMRQEEETGVIEEEVDPAAESAAAEQKQKKAEAELEKIAAGLAQAKTIEDVDDKMAETLFGEELSIAAAAVVAKAAEEKQAAGEPTNERDPAPAADAPSANPVPVDNGQPTELEQEFENVWGETPNVEVSIESQFEQKQGGLDISASQRLATVRALNSEQPATGSTNAASANPATPAAKPEPIEEQITTSMTQTLKALNVRSDPAPVNDDDDDDDDDDRKSGFFSRFRRS